MDPSPGGWVHEVVEFLIVDGLGLGGVGASGDQLFGGSADYGVGGLRDRRPQTDSGDATFRQFRDGGGARLDEDVHRSGDALGERGDHGLVDDTGDENPSGAGFK